MDPGDCVVCGRNVHEGGRVRDFYELTYNYYELDDARFATLVVPGTNAPVTFCSAKCLCVYVAANIAPDASIEDDSGSP
jgi:hypothetical protein